LRVRRLEIFFGNLRNLAFNRALMHMIVSFLIFSWVWSSVNNPLRKSCLLGIPYVDKVMERFDWSS